MRTKELRVVAAFETTTAAMAFEAKAKESDIKGRLIPVPREITSGCGLSFSAPISEREAVKRMADQMPGIKIYEIII